MQTNPYKKKNQRVDRIPPMSVWSSFLLHSGFFIFVCKKSDLDLLMPVKNRLKFTLKVFKIFAAFIFLRRIFKLE